jgi:hypothetical protein
LRRKATRPFNVAPFGTTAPANQRVDKAADE